MSRILRRPMFRGGPVDSRGTGITANLGYNNGGRVGFDNGGSPFLRTPISMSGGQITEAQKKKPFLNDLIYSAGMPFPYERTTPLKNIELTDTSVEKEDTPTGDIFSKMKDYLDVNESNIFEGYENFEDLPKSTQNITSKTNFDRYQKEQEDIKESIQSDINTKGYLPTPGPEKGSVPKIKTNLLSDDSILNNQNTANEELTLEEIRDTLGYKKAFRRDLGDTFGRGAAAFIGAESLTEGAKKFFELENQSGPGRAEKIETAAATFMLKNKAQTKRDKANIALMKSKVDYQIEAGESISLPKSLLAANKSGMLNNKELSVGIQAATSPTTGKNFNFKKVVTLEEFKNIKNAQPGDTFVVKTTVKDPDTGTEKILKSIIEIDLDGTPQRIYNIA